MTPFVQAVVEDRQVMPRDKKLFHIDWFVNFPGGAKAIGPAGMWAKAKSPLRPETVEPTSVPTAPLISSILTLL